MFLMHHFLTNAAVQQTGVGTVSGCCPRGDCETQELVRFLTNLFLYISLSVCIYYDINCSVSALKDREERYRLHLNRQFETLSDAKNIEEQVFPHFFFCSAMQFMQLTFWQHIRVEAHELHIALGKWESEYFGTVSPTVGAAQEQQVIFCFVSFFWIMRISHLQMITWTRPTAKICTLHEGMNCGATQCHAL